MKFIWMNILNHALMEEFLLAYHGLYYSLKTDYIEVYRPVSCPVYRIIILEIKSCSVSKNYSNLHLKTKKKEHACLWSSIFQATFYTQIVQC